MGKFYVSAPAASRWLDVLEPFDPRLPQLDFQRLLAGRRIPLHCGIDAMEHDLRRAKRLSEID